MLSGTITCRLSRARWGLGAAERQPFMLANVLHVDRAGGEAQELVGLAEQRPRGLPGEGEPLCHAAAGEYEVANRGARLPGGRLLVAPQARRWRSKAEQGRAGHVAGPGQPDLDCARTRLIGIHPEVGQPRSHLGAAIAPAARKRQDTGDERRRGDGLRLQQQDRVAAELARRLLIAAGGAAARDDRDSGHGRGGPGAGHAGAKAPGSRRHATTVQPRTTTSTAATATASTSRLRAIRRRLQCWMATGRRCGARARNWAIRSRPSCFRTDRSWEGLATPRAAANASAISPAVKYRKACW